MMSLKLEMLKKKKKSVLNYVKSFSYLLKCNPRNFACKHSISGPGILSPYSKSSLLY